MFHQPSNVNDVDHMLINMERPTRHNLQIVFKNLEIASKDLLQKMVFPFDGPGAVS